MKVLSRGEMHLKGKVIPITWLEFDDASLYYQLFDFVDKNGRPVPCEWIISDGQAYYQIWFDPEQGTIHGMSCTKGYLHMPITQEMLRRFEVIGSIKDNPQYLVCD